MKDEKDVSLITTVHSMTTQEVEMKKERIMKRKLVIDGTMAGVDRVDQHLSDYVIPRKRKKKQNYFHLLY